MNEQIKTQTERAVERRVQALGGEIIELAWHPTRVGGIVFWMKTNGHREFVTHRFSTEIADDGHGILFHGDYMADAFDGFENYKLRSGR